MIYFDIETDDLHAKEVYCVGILDAEGNDLSCMGISEAAREILETADALCGHNIIGFDLPVLEELHGIKPKKGCKIIDTYILAQLLLPNAPSHSLKSLGNLVGEEKTTMPATNGAEMLAYCVQDVRVTAKLHDYLKEILAVRDDITGVIEFENRVAQIISRQSRYGVKFDVAKAFELCEHLKQEEESAATQLKAAAEVYIANHKDDVKICGEIVKKRAKGKVMDFNWNSPQQVAEYLSVVHKWIPGKKTKTGKPALTEEILETLDYPEISAILKMHTAKKRLGTLLEGDKAWLKMVRNGVIHGGVKTIGAITGRMTHHSPTLGNVVARDKLYGPEFRSLFTVREGKKMVGVDADAIELRLFSGYLSRFDGGEFIHSVLEGKKEDKTDAHSRNAAILNCDRNTAKSFMFAMLYGAGRDKLGVILTGASGRGDIGGVYQAKFKKEIKGFKAMLDKIKFTLATIGYVKALDGRQMRPEKEHAALNYIIQSADSIIMKQALIICDDDLQALGFKPKGVDYEFVLNVHDEFQIEVREDIAETVAKVAEEAIRKAGEHFRFPCPLKGTANIGMNWYDTH